MAEHHEETLRLLGRARAYLLDPGHWTKGALARDDRGREVGPGAVGVASRSLGGAIFWFGRHPLPHWPEGSSGLAGDLLDSVLVGLFPPHTNYDAWEDRPNTTHDQVLRLLDAAISRVREASSPRCGEHVGG